MKLLKSLMLAAALALAGTSAVAQPGAGLGPVVAAAHQRGKLIYELDQAAWHTTDVLRVRLPRSRHPEVRGWIVEPSGDGYTVNYYGLVDGEPYAVFVAQFGGGQVGDWRVVPADGPRAFSPGQVRMIRAREAASQTSLRPCANEPFNSVIIPPSSDAGPVEVYLLTPQTKPDEYPLGGHYLLRIDGEGRVVSSRPFMKSCFTHVREPDAVGWTITHLLDPTPTEIHAFVARWANMPIYVVVIEPKSFWVVSTDGIKLGMTD